MPEGFVLLGEIGRAHGLRGEVRIKSYTEDPRAIGRYGPLVTQKGREIVIASLRPAAGDQPDMFLATIEGVTTREAAEALTRAGLHLPRDRLGAAAEDEFYLADLVGLEARDAAGSRIGRVLAVPNFGGGDLLEIAPFDGGQSFLLPFTKACVPEIDVAGGTLVVALPAEIEAESGPDEPA